jgi:hypothetical protein
MASAVTLKASLQITAGRPAASNAMPSATAEALHEPQSPMPVTMTSQVAAISLIVGA